MPAVSKKQFRFMKGVASGGIKAPGLSPLKADEYTKENTGKMAYSHLPAFKRLKKLMSKG